MYKITIDTKHNSRFIYSIKSKKYINITDTKVEIYYKDDLEKERHKFFPMDAVCYVSVEEM